MQYIFILKLLKNFLNWRDNQPIVLILPSAHTARPIYPTHFAGNSYTARITTTITPV